MLGTSSSSGGLGSSGDALDTGISTGFITDPDGGGGCGGFQPDNALAHCSVECIPWQQEDCGRGEGCKVADLSGSGTWSNPLCTSIPGDASLPGELCTVEDSPMSGSDTCAAGSMCWDVDGDTLEGTCIEFCTYDDGPRCTDPTRTCFNGNHEYLPICLPSCSPLLQDCEEEGSGCYPGTYGDFVCIRENTPAYVDASTLHPACPTGSFMVTEEAVDECPEGEPCCTSFCDLAAPDCDEGFVCEPYFVDLEGIDEAYVDTGFCRPSA